MNKLMRMYICISVFLPYILWFNDNFNLSPLSSCLSNYYFDILRDGIYTIFTNFNIFIIYYIYIHKLNCILVPVKFYEHNYYFKFIWYV